MSSGAAGLRIRRWTTTNMKFQSNWWVLSDVTYGSTRINQEKSTRQRVTDVKEAVRGPL